MENNGPIQIIDLSGVDFNVWLRLWQRYLAFNVMRKKRIRAIC